MWVRDPATASSANGPSSRSARGRRSCSWICLSRGAPAMMSGARLLGRHRRVWLAIAAVPLAAIAAALAPPPAGTRRDRNGRRLTFAALASAAIVALSVLPFIVLRGAGRPPIWLTAAIVALALGIASFSAGGYAQRACTARYAGKPIVIGTEMTTLGATYKQANPSFRVTSCCSTLPECPTGSGPAARSTRCRTFISSTYFLWIPFLVVCLLATVQAIPPRRCRRSSGTPRRRRTLGADAPARYDVFISYRHDGNDTESRPSWPKRSKPTATGSRSTSATFRPMPAFCRRWNDASARAAPPWR